MLRSLSDETLQPFAILQGLKSCRWDEDRRTLYIYVLAWTDCGFIHMFITATNYNRIMFDCTVTVTVTEALVYCAPN